MNNDTFNMEEAADALGFDEQSPPSICESESSDNEEVIGSGEMGSNEQTNQHQINLHFDLVAPQQGPT